MLSSSPFNKLSRNAKLVLTEAQKAAEFDGKNLRSDYLLLALVEIPGTLSHDILKEYSINLDQIKMLLSIDKTKQKNPGVIGDEAKDILRIAFRVAADYGHYSVDTEHILVGILSSETHEGYKLIKKVGIDPKQIKSQIQDIFSNITQMDQMITHQQNTPEFDKNELDHYEENSFDMPPMPGPPAPEMQQDGYSMPPLKTQSPPKKAIEVFATNLVEKAKKGEIDPVWGRDNEIARATQILLRKAKNNPVFIGEPGVGKTAIVEGLALRISQGKVPSPLIGKKIYQLDLGQMIAGTMYRGQFEDRLKKVISEIKKDKNIIIFIDELHTIVGAGSAEGSMDASNLLKPALAKGEIRMIGATTFDEYRKHLEKDAALERRLQTIKVLEPTVEETISILNGIKSAYEKHHKVKVDKSAIEAAARLSKKYINYRFLPDKAIDLIDEASAAKTLEKNTSEVRDKLNKIRHKIEELSAFKERLISEEKFEQAAKVRDEELKQLEIEKGMLDSETTGDEKITDRDIARLISEISGIPAGEILEDEIKKFMTIEKDLSSHIAGQKEAIGEIAKSLRRNRSGISSGDRPIGSFIFLGPSGVGKTEVARVLARHIYGSENALIKLDMSEFMERHNTALLVGAPPGYVGYEDAGKLTEAVRKNPYSVILFDEIEKAHPDVFNILLQLLDEGRLTDAKGRKVDFTHSVIIMTSNIGIEEYNKISKFGFIDGSDKAQDIKDKVKDDLKKVFKPELVNRIDRVIVFDPLTEDEFKIIAKIHLDKLKDKLKIKKISLSYDQKTIEKLSKLASDKVFGARPLIREIEHSISDEISSLIISGKIKEGDKVKIYERQGNIKIAKA